MTDKEIVKIANKIKELVKGKTLESLKQDFIQNNNIAIHSFKDQVEDFEAWKAMAECSSGNISILEQYELLMLLDIGEAHPGWSVVFDRQSLKANLINIKDEMSFDLDAKELTY